MKKLGLLISATLFTLIAVPNTFALTATQIPQPNLSHTESLDSIIAVVNNQIITQHQLDQAVGQTEQEMESQNVPIPSSTALHKQVLNKLIYATLQLQLAQRMSIQVSDQQLNQALANIAKRNNITVSQLRASVIERGMEYPQYRKRIRDQIIISKLQQRVISPEISVTNEEVKEYLKNYKQQKHRDTQYHVLDILIPLSGTPSSKQVTRAKNEANKIMKQLRMGANFKRIAAAHSAGQQAFKGGNLGWNALAGLPNIFAKRLITMNPGEVAGPIRAANGYHIIKLAGVRNKTSKLTNKQIKDIIYERKYAQRLQSWLQQLRTSSYVRILP